MPPILTSSCQCRRRENAVVYLHVFFMFKFTSVRRRTSRRSRPVKTTRGTGVNSDSEILIGRDRKSKGRKNILTSESSHRFQTTTVKTYIGRKYILNNTCLATLTFLFRFRFRDSSSPLVSQHAARSRKCYSNLASSSSKSAFT